MITTSYRYICPNNKHPMLCYYGDTVSHLMIVLLTISAAGTRRKITKWGRRLGKYANAADNHLSNDDIDHDHDNESNVMKMYDTI